MATKRPIFNRADTDIALTDVDHESGSSTKNNVRGERKEEFQSHGVYETDGDTNYDVTAEYNHFGEAIIVKNAENVVTHALHVDDDLNISPWTFRALFLGSGLSIFASVLQEIFYFKPQVIVVSIVFLAVISYILGEGLAFIIPRVGTVGRFFNPGPFNSKEHAFIVCMASAAATTAGATLILAAQKLYYGMDPSSGSSVFLVISSQLLGYGIAGLLRSVLVQPTKMLWPMNIPVNSMLETLHGDKKETKHRLKFFYIVFFCLFVYEVIPEYIFPVLQGVSIFCLADQHSLVFTNLFGGSQGNEGLGFLSLCFDWQFIASLGSPIWAPIQTLVSSGIGYILGIVYLIGLYYGNIWRSKDFPFMSQLLFDTSSNATNFVPYNLSAVLTPTGVIDSDDLQATGIPYLTGSYIGYLITTNLGLTATIVHMFLWNYDDIKGGWMWLRPANLRKLLDPHFYVFWKGGKSKEQHVKDILEDPSMDPHYKLMMGKGYDEAPTWWWGAVLLASFAIGLGTLYGIQSTLPWWGFIIANLFCALFILFFGAQYAITGFYFDLQPVIQMIAGYLFPGKPLANMYFTVFGANGVLQGEYLARDLKFAQLAHLSPKATFTAQILGSIIGSIFNYVMMQTIVTNQFDILTAIESSNVWSGQVVQQYNTLAIAWSIAGEMFSIGARYQWVTISYLLGFLIPIPFYILYRVTKHHFFKYINLAIVVWYMGFLFVGTNSQYTMYWLLGFAAQGYLRNYHPNLFVKYNYLVSAALDGGTQVIIFILSFALFGAGGNEVFFPLWAGNNGGFSQGRNFDYCAFNPANAG